MKQHLGWWFPDQETHFVQMLDKSVNKGGPARYQYQVRDRSLVLCDQFRTAIDIGANVGLWSRDLVTRFQRVIAFEPVDIFRECLERNVPVKTNFEVETCALGERSGQIDMIITQDNMGHTHVDPDSFGRGATPIRTLDSFAYLDIDYVKIDCEGFEYRVLQGAEETIRRCRCMVVVEQKPHDAYREQYSQHAAVELLQSWGMVRVDQIKDDWIMKWPQ